jgi:hypothetical protein
LEEKGVNVLDAIGKCQFESGHPRGVITCDTVTEKDAVAEEYTIPQQNAVAQKHAVT